MKERSSVCEFAYSQTMNSFFKRFGIRVPVFGFAAGFIAAAIYVFLGGNTFLFVPRWAFIIFYPGFWTGGITYAFVDDAFPDGFAYWLGVAIGCVTVGMFYSVLASGIAFAVTRVQPNADDRL